MADFCQECSIENFGKDFRELAGLTTAENMKDGLAVWALCEGCGHIPVDPDGKRIGEKPHED